MCVCVWNKKAAHEQHNSKNSIRPGARARSHSLTYSLSSIAENAFLLAFHATLETVLGASHFYFNSFIDSVSLFFDLFCFCSESICSWELERASDCVCVCVCPCVNVCWRIDHTVSVSVCLYVLENVAREWSSNRSVLVCTSEHIQPLTLTLASVLVCVCVCIYFTAVM